MGNIGDGEIQSTLTLQGPRCKWEVYPNRSELASRRLFLESLIDLHIICDIYGILCYLRPAEGTALVRVALNPVEYLWAHWKQYELPNFSPDSYGKLSYMHVERCAACADGRP